MSIDLFDLISIEYIYFFDLLTSIAIDCANSIIISWLTHFILYPKK